jgi:orotate phosphoribosyltransferase
MDQAVLFKQLDDVNAIIRNSHIVYTSGQHGSVYVNKDAVYPYVDTVSDICKEFAHEFDGFCIDCVVGPAMGGIILAQWTASHCVTSQVRAPLAFFAEKEGEIFVFRRGYDKLLLGKKVLVVEDILTTGGSVKRLVEAIRKLGGEVIGVAAICNRGGVTAEDLGVPVLYCLLSVDLESWTEEECPLCKAGVPINTEVGKGREYLARKAQE